MPFGQNVLNLLRRNLCFYSKALFYLMLRTFKDPIRTGLGAKNEDIKIECKLKRVFKIHGIGAQDFKLTIEYKVANVERKNYVRKIERILLNRVQR